MKTHQFMKGGYVKLNTPFYMDSNRLTDDKAVQDQNGDYTIYLYDENQQQVLANYLVGSIHSLVEKNLDKILKEAKEYVGSGKIVRK